MPGVLYDKWDRYNHFNTGIYDNDYSNDIYPVCYVNDKQKLDNALRFILNKEKEDKNSRYESFNAYKYGEDYGDNLKNFLKSSLEMKLTKEN